MNTATGEAVAPHIDLGFKCEVVAISVDAEAAAQLVREAHACLSGPVPDICKKGCEKCEYMRRRAEVGRRMAQPA